MKGPGFPILEARPLAPGVTYFRVEAPKVARRRRAGQFVIVRVAGDGERIPLTIAEADPNAGWVSLVVQGVGKTTRVMNMLKAGDVLADLAGPLGTPTAVGAFGTVVVVGGGVGTAIAYPAALALGAAGNDIVAIVGGRSADLVLFADELRAAGAEVIVTTEDGSLGRQGLVTEPLAEIVAGESRPGLVHTAGPVPMMRAVAEITRPYGIETVASLNPIMVDGTGMCGGCRVAVGGETKFACVDGPEFDAHLVDFDLLARRNAAYRDFEQLRNAELDRLEACGLGLEVR